MDVADEKLFLGNELLDRKLCSVFGELTISIRTWSTEWRDLLYLEDSGVWLIDELLPINTGILDLDEFFRIFSGDMEWSIILSMDDPIVVLLHSVDEGLLTDLLYISLLYKLRFIALDDFGESDFR